MSTVNDIYIYSTLANAAYINLTATSGVATSGVGVKIL